jgi:hypothetical protein
MSTADKDISIGIFDKYGKAYGTWALAILTSPESIVVRTRELSREGGNAQYLLPILIVSVFLGVTIGQLIPERPPFQSRAAIFCVVSILWVFMSLLVHGICRLFGGKAGALTTLSLMIQDLAFVYVASNFLTLIVSWIAVAYPPLHKLLVERELFSSTGEILFSFQFLMLLYLVPVTVSKAHEFHGFRWIMVAVFAAAFAVFFGIPVFSMGGC